MSRVMRSCTMLLHRHAYDHVRAQAATLHQERVRHRRGAPVPPGVSPQKGQERGMGRG
ncbi:MAG: hypothetical protein N2595_10880 [bacterium]|nr:hypothetical protein [bacterium]